MRTNRTPQPTGARPPGVPSRRVVGALVAGALALGVLAGASLAPAPPSSLASSSTIVTRLLALLAAGASKSQPSATPSAAPAAASASTTAGKSSPSDVRSTGSTVIASSEPGNAPAGSSTESSSPSGPGKGSGEKRPVRLPPISHVWLVVLGGAGFAQASAAPASYPYLTGQLLKGVLLERYSAIEGYELAGDAALLTGGVGESVSTIAEPACGSSSASSGGSPGAGTPSGSCPGAPGQAAADAFLQRVAAPILASSAYGEHGLIVVTFGSAAQEAGLTATTLASQPPTGVLLLSGVLKAGGHSSETFNSLAPRESLEAIFEAS